MFTGVWRPALGDLDPNPPLTPERRVEPHSEPLSLLRVLDSLLEILECQLPAAAEGGGGGQNPKNMRCLVAPWGAELGRFC